MFEHEKQNQPLRTAQIADAVGCHPNTVRMYEKWGYIPKAPRSNSNYRIFKRLHLDHMELAWKALRGNYPGRVIRRSTYQVVKKAAQGDLGGALEMAYAHLALVQFERAQAEAAVELLERWSMGKAVDATLGVLQIGATAHLLGVTTDMLRNWEKNGLLHVPRANNGYRQYGAKEIGRLRVIRMLVRAGYSMMSILRMLLFLDKGNVGNLREILDNPPDEDDIFSAADQWLTTLTKEEEKANNIIKKLGRMIEEHTII